MKHLHILISAIIIISATLFTPVAAALDPGYYAPHSSMADGRWVKIRIDSAGIHALTFDTLRRWGFSDPSRVGVMGYPVSVLASDNFSTDIPDDLPQTPSIITGDRLIFYAEPGVSVNLLTGSKINVERNFYSTEGYLFLTELPSASERVEPVIRPLQYFDDDESLLTTHSSLIFHEPEEVLINEGGAHYFGRLMEDTTPTPYMFDLPGIVRSKVYGASLNYLYVGNSVARASMVMTPGFNMETSQSSTQVQIPATPTSSSNNYSISANPSRFQFRLGSEEPDRIGFSLAKAPATGCSFMAVDKIWIIYPRYNILTGAQMEMFFPGCANGENVTVEVPGENSLVWRVTPSHRIERLATEYDEDESTMRFSLNDESNSRIIVFDPEADLLAPGFAGEVNNSDLHSLATPELLIITHSGLTSQAEAIAELHRRYQSLDVTVAVQDDIFNEFSSGSRSAHGLRRFVKMLYDRQPERLRYVMLVGAGTTDPRGLTHPSNSDCLVTFEAALEDHARSNSRNYATDNYFGMLSDSFDPLNITSENVNVAVGRIPTNDPELASRFVDKLAAYLENPPLDGSYTRMAAISDSGDENSHMFQTEDVVNAVREANPAVTTSKLYSALYAYSRERKALGLQAGIKAALKRGTNFLFYSGHGSNIYIGFHTPIWSITLAKELTYDVWPVTMFATCKNYAVDIPTTDFTKTLLFHPEGGSIAMLASSRSVYQEHNRKIAVAFASEYYNAGGDDCVGDIYRRAHNSVIGPTDIPGSINALCYNLAGDPALPLYAPSRTVAVNPIEGPVDPLVPFTISGSILSADSSVDTSFSGSATIDIYESAVEVNSLTQNPGDLNPEPIRREEALLASYKTEVVNGRWQVDAVAPFPSAEGADHLITVYAASTDRVTATGTGRLTISDSIHEKTDNDGPRIAAIYLDSPDFTEGSTVSSSPTVHAVIEADPSGLSCSEAIIGGGVRLTLDNKSTIQLARYGLSLNPDGSADYRYRLSGLEPGRHTVSLSLSDNASNHSTRSVSFVVSDETVATLTTSSPVARDEAEFSIVHPLGGDSATGRLVVEDLTGNAVWSADNCTFPYRWGLTDAEGSRIPDGNYRVYAIVQIGRNAVHTLPVKLTVIAHPDK